MRNGWARLEIFLLKVKYKGMCLDMRVLRACVLRALVVVSSIFLILILLLIVQILFVIYVLEFCVHRF